MTVPMKPHRHAMTVDVEDYFQVSAFDHHIPRETWDTWPRRVEANTDALLALFAERGVRATFFVLGWVAERHPGLVRRIVAEGHELASHGYGHRRVTQLSPEAFRADIGRARRLLEDIGGVPVSGYRAPSFSIGPQSLWAHDALAAEGYAYSSSVYPISHDHYGMPDAPRAPYRVADGRLLEIPISTLCLGRWNLPCGGGGYFRLLPSAYFLAAFRRLERSEGRSGVFYIHPWELDPGQPRVSGLPTRTRLRHYLNLSRTADRLRVLIERFTWDRMDSIFLTA